MASSQIFNLNSFQGTPRVAIVACISPVSTFKDAVDNPNCQLIGISNGLQRAQDWTSIRLPNWRPDQPYEFIQVFVLNDGPYQEEITISLDNISISSLTTSTHEEFLRQALRVIPNPFRNTFTIDFTTPISSQTMVNIRNAQGQLVQQQWIPVGTIRHQFSMQQETKGLYFLELYDKEGAGILIKKNHSTLSNTAT